MARLCKTCTHPERGEIDSRLARGESPSAIARAFGLPGASVERHVDHVAGLISQRAGDADALGLEVAEIEAQLTRELTEKVNFLAKEAVRLKGIAAQLSDMKTVLALIRELKGIYEMRLRAKELERSRPERVARNQGSLLDHATARKMAEAYLSRHHVGDKLRELKETDANG